MVKLVEVVDDEMKSSSDPKDIISAFLKEGLAVAKFHEDEVGKSDKEVNNFMARMRVYLKYHKLNIMVDVSRQRPYIYIRKKEVGK